MSQVITNAFEQYWQSSLAAEQPVVLDEFILADIPNLDITAPIDPDTILPPESQIVHRQSVDQRGRINNNAVAYTIVMDTTVGDFSFNAMYLRNKQNGVIGMIVYKGRETKLKTDQTTGQTGNSLVKSMLMGYDQAAEATLTHVDAGTWQIDYAARLRGMDEDIRQLQADLYGHHTFVGDGFKVVEKDGAYQVSQGVAIIGGLRVELKAPEVIHPGSKPIGVWVDVHRAGSLLSEHQSNFTIITSVADLTDHVDSNGYQHYVAKLGAILDHEIYDCRAYIKDEFSFNELLCRLVNGDELLSLRVAEATRMVCAEMGLDLRPFPESFSNGGVLLSEKEVMIDERNGFIYSFGGPFPHFVEKGVDPEGGGYIRRRDFIISIAEAFGLNLNLGGVWCNGVLATDIKQWFTYGGEVWSPLSVPVTLPASPNYDGWVKIASDGVFRPSQFGAIGDADKQETPTDDTAAFERALTYCASIGRNLIPDFGKPRYSVDSVAIPIGITRFRRFKFKARKKVEHLVYTKGPEFIGGSNGIRCDIYGNDGDCCGLATRFITLNGVEFSEIKKNKAAGLFDIADSTGIKVWFNCNNLDIEKNEVRQIKDPAAGVGQLNLSCIQISAETTSVYGGIDVGGVPTYPAKTTVTDINIRHSAPDFAIFSA